MRCLVWTAALSLSLLASPVALAAGLKFTNKTTGNALGSNLVNGVYVNGSTVYAATNGGLGVSSDGGGTSFLSKTSADGLNSSQVYPVSASGGNIDAATDGGLSISQAPIAVPGPMPTLGAAAAFEMARRLRTAAPTRVSE